MIFKRKSVRAVPATSWEQEQINSWGQAPMDQVPNKVKATGLPAGWDASAWAEFMRTFPTHAKPNIRLDLGTKTCNELDSQEKMRLEKMAVTIPDLPEGNWIARDIFPHDFGLSSWKDLNAQEATIQSEVWISIYKIIQLSAYPLSNEIKFQVNGVVRGDYSLAGAYKALPIVETLLVALMDPEARRVFERLSGSTLHENLLGHEMAIYFEPIFFKPGDRVVFMLDESRQDGKSDELAFVGCVAERNGRTIANRDWFSNGRMK